MQTERELARENSSDGVIVVESLRREYTSRSLFSRTTKTTIALRDISLKVFSGELFGLIGPNGAGKTTTIKILTTLLTPTSGRARILGLDMIKDVYEIRRRIGIVFGGERGLYNRVTAIENLKYFADLYGVPPRISRERIPMLVEKVGLSGRENERVERYSRGMKQRLHIAKALVHDPELVFLDEPTIGLDPGGARDIREMIRQMRSAGKTVFLTTHNMFEADELCDRIAVISKGSIVALDTPAGLKQTVKEISVIELQTFGATDAFVEGLQRTSGVTRVVAELDSERQIVKIQTATPTEVLLQIGRAAPSDVKIIDRSIKQPTLEDAYLRLVEE